MTISGVLLVWLLCVVLVLLVWSGHRRNVELQAEREQEQLARAWGRQRDRIERERGDAA